MLYILPNLVNYINTFDVLEAQSLARGGTNPPFVLKGGGQFFILVVPCLSAKDNIKRIHCSIIVLCVLNKE